MRFKIALNQSIKSTPTRSRHKSTANTSHCDGRERVTAQPDVAYRCLNRAPAWCRRFVGILSFARQHTPDDEERREQCQEAGGQQIGGHNDRTNRSQCIRPCLGTRQVLWPVEHHWHWRHLRRSMAGSRWQYHP